MKIIYALKTVYVHIYHISVYEMLFLYVYFSLGIEVGLNWL